MLLVWAATVCPPQLSDIVPHLRDAGLVPAQQLGRYDRMVVSTRRLLLSRWVDVAVVGLAYVGMLSLPVALYDADTASWVRPSSYSPRRLSLAGWWRMLVSQPVFLGLVALWLWRLLLWTRFIWGVARLDLNLVAGHPDRLGGLGVVKTCLKGFSVIAFAVGVVAAGTVAEQVAYEGRSLADFRLLIVAQVVGVVFVLAGPLLLLLRPLLTLHQRGTFEYGRLASEVGREFESRWTSGQRVDATALAAADFSATTDLYSIVANAQAVNLFVLDFPAVIRLAAATLLPYVPVLFLVLPLEDLLQMGWQALM
jgi:hypothetical protein